MEFPFHRVPTFVDWLIIAIGQWIRLQKQTDSANQGGVSHCFIMANIAVLESHQSDTDTPTGGRIKRSAGYSLVNRGEAYWVKKPVLLKRIAAPTPRDTYPIRAQHPRYIPDELPPAEVYGCTFDDPVQRAQWILPFTRLWAESQESQFCRA